MGNLHAEIETSRKSFEAKNSESSMKISKQFAGRNWNRCYLGVGVNSVLSRRNQIKKLEKNKFVKLNLESTICVDHKV